jgi:hypothetical protein
MPSRVARISTGSISGWASSWPRPDANAPIGWSTGHHAFVDATVIIVNVVGWIGMALLISAYGLVTVGRLHGPDLTFQLMNLVGGSSLMVNTAYYGAWPSAALNFVWVVIGVVGLTRARLRPAPAD